MDTHKPVPVGTVLALTPALVLLLLSLQLLQVSLPAPLLLPLHP